MVSAINKRYSGDENDPAEPTGLYHFWFWGNGGRRRAGVYRVRLVNSNAYGLQGTVFKKVVRGAVFLGKDETTWNIHKSGGTQIPQESGVPVNPDLGNPVFIGADASN